ncbi:MAG: preprotein translocase subunit TatC, partial [Nitrospinota bacterium]
MSTYEERNTLSPWEQIMVVGEKFRQGLLRVILVIVAISLLAYLFSDRLIFVLQWPIRFPLYLYAPTEAFITKIKLALFCGFFLSAPYLFYTIWKAATLPYRVEKRALTVVVVTAASLLFFAGALLCYFLVLRFALTFLLGFGNDQIQPAISAGRYFNFAFLLLLAFGLIFELPLVLLLLARGGLVDV